MSDPLAETRRLLDLEYGQVRSKVDALETLRFRIKEWAISISGILMGLGITTGKRAVIVLCVPVALLLAQVEADYLVRQRSLTARSDELEAVMEAVRRHGYGPEAESYVFGLRAVSRAGYTMRNLPPMFGRESRAGFAYLLIILGAIITATAI